MKFKGFLHDSKGVTSIEYALIASLIFLVIVSAVGLVGTNLGELYNQVLTSIVNALQ
jgi:pilus assembly protein Flp/PilA